MKIKQVFFIGYIGIIISWFNLPVKAQEINQKELDIPEEIINDSPVLQRWLEETPNVLEDIRHDPSFSTRLKIGFSLFPSNDDAVGINIALEDVFLAKTGLTVSTDYYTTFNGERVSVGANLHYFLLPLGNHINFAPLIGYRYVQSDDYSSDLLPHDIYSKNSKLMLKRLSLLTLEFCNSISVERRRWEVNA